MPPAIAPVWEVERCDEEEFVFEVVALALELEETGVGVLVMFNRGGGRLGMRLPTAIVREMFDLH